MSSMFFDWKPIFAPLGFASIKPRKHKPKNNSVRSLRLEPMEDRRMMAILTVNSLADTHINTDGVLTLREAIEVVQQGNTNGLDGTTITNQISGPVGNDTIKFASNIDGGTVTLSLNLGQILFSKSLTIDASDRSTITINGNDPTPGPTGHGIRIFNIRDDTAGLAPPEVTLIDLTLIGSDVAGEGGAIRSEGTLVIRGCTIEENEANLGGALYVRVEGGAISREVLKIENSAIHNNRASTGAGVAIVSGSLGAPTMDTALIAGTEISENKEATEGGGVYALLHGARLTISDSTLNLNESISGNGTGGGILARLNDGATLTVVGSDFEHNDGHLGAGLHAALDDQSTLRVETSTFYDNEATNHGGGVYASVDDSTFEMIASEFRQNDSGNDGGGIFTESLNASNVTIDGTRFELNFADNGGGVFVLASSASVEIDESTFLNNDAIVSGGGIHAVLGDDATVGIVNSSIELN